MENEGKLATWERWWISFLISRAQTKRMSSSGKQPAPQCRASGPARGKDPPTARILLLQGDRETGRGPGTEKCGRFPHCCLQTEKAAFSKHQDDV